VTGSVLLIVGPTAVGKTEVSLELAKLVDSEIVSADSRQVYKYMDIGTAKPTEGQRAQVRHHFIDVKYPDEYYSAGQYGREARDCIEEILSRRKLPVVVGGSGLYIRALVDGVFEPKVSDVKIKSELKRQTAVIGISAMYERLKSVDPVTADRLHASDTQRILRALEVYEITGQPFSVFLENNPKPANFRPVFFGLTLERGKLYSKIEARVEKMFADGFLDEVKELKSRGYESNLNALQTVGYKEAFLFLEGRIDFAEMVDLIKQKSRNYAKRQMTWFRKDPRIHWVDVGAFKNTLGLVSYVHHEFYKLEKINT
jgi:tRNA dimethylallyltransferase